MVKTLYVVRSVVRAPLCAQPALEAPVEDATFQCAFLSNISNLGIKTVYMSLPDDDQTWQAIELLYAAGHESTDYIPTSD